MLLSKRTSTKSLQIELVTKYDTYKRMLKRAGSSGSVNKISGETARIISEYMRVVL